jgi:hypothetical protein
MPPAGEEDDASAAAVRRDPHRIGAHRGHLLDRLGVPREQLEAHVGFFEDTFRPSSTGPSPRIR